MCGFCDVFWLWTVIADTAVQAGYDYTYQSPALTCAPSKSMNFIIVTVTWHMIPLILVVHWKKESTYIHIINIDDTTYKIQYTRYKKLYFLSNIYNI